MRIYTIYLYIGSTCLPILLKSTLGVNAHKFDKTNIFFFKLLILAITYKKVIYMYLSSKLHCIIIEEMYSNMLLFLLKDAMDSIQ